MIKLNVLQCEANCKVTHIVLFFFSLVRYCHAVNHRNLFSLQILKDEATREKYDYAIAHPEEVFRFSYR